MATEAFEEFKESGERDVILFIIINWSLSFTYAIKDGLGLFPMNGVWVVEKNGMKKLTWKAKRNIREPHGRTSCFFAWGLCFYIYIDWLIRKPLFLEQYSWKWTEFPMGLLQLLCCLDPIMSHSKTFLFSFGLFPWSRYIRLKT